MNEISVFLLTVMLQSLAWPCLATSGCIVPFELRSADLPCSYLFQTPSPFLVFGLRGQYHLIASLHRFFSVPLLIQSAYFIQDLYDDLQELWILCFCC